MMNLLLPILITTSQTIYGWNAMYAAGRVPEMKEQAFNALELKAAEKCGIEGPEYLSSPEYTRVYSGAYYVEHAFVYIHCGRNP